MRMKDNKRAVSVTEKLLSDFNRKLQIKNNNSNLPKII